MNAYIDSNDLVGSWRIIRVMFFQMIHHCIWKPARLHLPKIYPSATAPSYPLFKRVRRRAVQQPFECWKITWDFEVFIDPLGVGLVIHCVYATVFFSCFCCLSQNLFPFSQENFPTPNCRFFIPLIAPGLLYMSRVPSHYILNGYLHTQCLGSEGYQGRDTNEPLLISSGNRVAKQLAVDENLARCLWWSGIVEERLSFQVPKGLFVTQIT